MWILLAHEQAAKMGNEKQDYYLHFLFPEGKYQREKRASFG